MAINLKRLALALLFVLAVLGLAVTIYYVFFKNILGPTNRNVNINGVIFPTINENRNLNVNAANVNAVLPNVNALTGPPRQIADGGLTRTLPVVSTIPGGATLSNNGRDLLYYNPETGQFVQVSPDGRLKTPLSQDTYPSLERVTWSPLKDKAVLEFPDDSKFLYDFRKKKQYTLAPEMEEISFSPSGDRLSFKFVGDDPDDRFLVISNFDGTSSKTIEPLGDKENNFSVSWSPAGNVIGTFEESIDANRQRVIPIGQLGENFPSFTVSGRGFESIWSPAGDKILYSVFSKEGGYNPALYLADGRSESIGNNTTTLDLRTWPSKCTFGSGTSLYCAVPQYLEQGSGLFPELAKGIPDDFYRIDLVSGQKQFIARPATPEGEANITARQLFLSSDESLLYFYNERTKQVEKVQLK